MLKLRVALLANLCSKRCGQVLGLSRRRRRIELLALSGLLLMNSSAFASMDTSNMTCAQVQSYVKSHGQTLLTTGVESGNCSFDDARRGAVRDGYGTGTPGTVAIALRVIDPTKLEALSRGG